MSRHLFAVLVAIAMVGGCGSPAAPPPEGEVYVNTADEGERRLLLKLDGTFSLKTPKGEFKGTFSREPETIVILGENNVRTKLRIQGSDLVDGAGLTWAKQ
jgi:hypothetical protein